VEEGRQFKDSFSETLLSAVLTSSPSLSALS